MRAMSVATTDLQRIAEGREAEIFAWDEGRVLRLFRTARSAQVLERETAAMRAVRAVVPLVPEVYEIVEVNGRAGIVMERIDGPDLITLLGSKPWRVYSAGTALGETHARINAIQAPAAVEPLKDRLRRIANRPEVPEESRTKLLEADRSPPGRRPPLPRRLSPGQHPDVGARPRRHRLAQRHGRRPRRRLRAHRLTPASRRAAARHAVAREVHAGLRTEDHPLAPIDART